MKSLIDEQIEAIAQAQEISVADASKLFVKNSDYVTELDNLPKQNHIWVDRGLKYSCEGAAHANHQAWKRGKATV
jgi:hypothetical protein